MKNLSTRVRMACPKSNSWLWWDVSPQRKSQAMLAHQITYEVIAYPLSTPFSLQVDLLGGRPLISTQSFLFLT